jgi:hypothetical protein
VLRRRDIVEVIATIPGPLFLSVKYAIISGNRNDDEGGDCESGGVENRGGMALPPGRPPNRARATEFVKEMNERHGSVTCAGILGLNLQDPDDMKRYYELDHWNTTCRDLIREATSLAYENIQKGG